jgi:hypothetical protein
LATVNLPEQKEFTAPALRCHSTHQQGPDEALERRSVALITAILALSSLDVRAHASAPHPPT